MQEIKRPKRDAILDAARTLFSQKGYEDTTIADIARVASIAVGTVYLYFHNKHEIYTAIALDIEAKLATVFEDPTFLKVPARQMIRALVEATFRVCHDFNDMMKLIQIDVQTKEEIQQHQHSNERLTQAVERLLQHLIERENLAPFNTALYAQMLTLFGGGVMEQCYGIEWASREDLYREWMIEFLERLFYGPPLIQPLQNEKTDDHFPQEHELV